MAQEKDFRPIYNQLFNLLPPYTLPAPWQDVPVPDSIRGPIANPVAPLADLLAVHPQADLVEANVLVHASDEKTEFNAALCQEGAAVIALRNAEGQDPFDLLAGGVMLSGRMLPMCASLRDGRVQKMIETSDEPVLCLCPSSADVALLLSLDIPATFDTGLAELGGTNLKQVWKDFQFDPPHVSTIDALLMDTEEDTPKKGNKPPALVYMACSLAKLSTEPGPGLAEVIAHLAALERHMGICMDPFYSFQPPKEYIESIAFRLKFADLDSVKLAIRDELDDVKHLVPPPKTADASDGLPQNILEAMEALKRHWSNPQRENGIERARWEKTLRRIWEHIDQLIEERSITPLLEALHTCDDPVEANFWQMAALTGRMLYPQQVRLALKLSVCEQRTPPDQLRLYPEKEFKQVMQLTEQQRKNFKSIGDHRKNPPPRWS